MDAPSCCRPVRRSRLFAAVAALLFAGLSVDPTHAADLGRPVEFDIPEKSLAEALTDFSRRIDAIIVAPTPLTAGKRSRPVSGRMTPIEALDALLRGSELRYVVGQDGAIVITGDEAPPARRDNAVIGGNVQVRTDPDAMRDNARDLPTIVVRKPFTDANVDIVRTEDDPQPYYIFDSEEIARANTPNLEEFLRQKLTMNQVAFTRSQNLGTGGNYSQVNLRGLGLDQTLILINGRRVASKGAGSGAPQFDLNAFAPAMIERIEVLPSSASAIYGGSAVGGVINVILKRDFEGGDIRFTYDTPLDTHAPNRSLSAGYGWSLEDGRTHITLSVAISDMDPPRLGSRSELLERGLSAIHSRVPQALYSADFPFRPGGTTPNIASRDGTPLVFKATGTPLGGTSIGSSLTYVPVGVSSGTSIADLQTGLLANAGRQNLELADNKTTNGLRNALGSPGEAKSLHGAVRRLMTDRLELVGEVFYSVNETDRLYSEDLLGVVPGSAPTNPFQQDVWVVLPTDPGRFNHRYESVRAVAGFVLDLPNAWRMQGDYTWNRSKTEQNFVPFFDFASGRARSAAALADGTLNPFVDTSGYPLDWSSYLTAADRQSVYLPSRLDDIGLRASGPIGQLPAGHPNLTVGLGFREEQQEGGYNDMAGYGRITYFPQMQRVKSLYGEVLVPLVAPANDVPGVRLLELQAASRLEDYSVSAGTTSRYTLPPNYTIPPTEVLVHEKIGYRSTNTTVALRYQPVESLTLRSSYATAFLPPSFADFLPGVPTASPQTGCCDPRRGNELWNARLLRGGNPDLEPMDSKALSIGLVFEPTFWKGLRAGVEWFRIERTNLIFRPDFYILPANEDLYPGRVVRADPEPGDPYGVGRITFIDASAINARHVSMEGFDVNLDYRRATEQWGTFGLSLLGTWIDSFTRQTTIDNPEQEIAGQVFNDGPLRLRANATLGWEKGPWSLNWTTLYYGPYDQNPNPIYVTAQGGTTVPHQVYHNLLAGYRIGPDRGVLSDVNVTLGISNVFDKSPPMDVNGYLYISPFGDYRLRSLQVSVHKRF